MQPIEAWVPLAIAIGLIVVAALVAIAWVWRSPESVDNPWQATIVGIAAFVLAVALWPLYPILLVFALPIALLLLVIYLLTRPRRPA